MNEASSNSSITQSRGRRFRCFRLWLLRQPRVVQCLLRPVYFFAILDPRVALVLDLTLFSSLGVLFLVVQSLLKAFGALGSPSWSRIVLTSMTLIAVLHAFLVAFLWLDGIKLFVDGKSRRMLRFRRKRNRRSSVDTTPSHPMPRWLGVVTLTAVMTMIGGLIMIVIGIFIPTAEGYQRVLNVVTLAVCLAMLVAILAPILGGMSQQRNRAPEIAVDKQSR